MKMDYLNISMDAQIALRINELSDKYDTQILMSGDMYDMLSQKGQESVREIDRVIIKESKDHLI